MKIKIELDEQLQEGEIIIRANSFKPKGFGYSKDTV